MARICQICGKTPRVGSKRRLLRGHYNPVKTQVRAPNLQWARLLSGKRVRACANCIKTLHRAK